MLVKHITHLYDSTHNYIQRIVYVDRNTCVYILPSTRILFCFTIQPYGNPCVINQLYS